MTFNQCLQILPLSHPATILLLSCRPRPRLRKLSDVRVYPPASCLLLVNVDPTGSSLSLTPGLHYQAFLATVGSQIPYPAEWHFI